MYFFLFYFQPVGSVKALKTEELEAPRLVLTVGKTLVQAFLVFDTVRMELKEPTTVRAIAMLLAAHHVLDVHYPDAYKNFFTVLDIHCLKKPDTVKPYSYQVFARLESNPVKTEYNDFFECC